MNERDGGVGDDGDEWEIEWEKEYMRKHEPYNDKDDIRGKKTG